MTDYELIEALNRAGDAEVMHEAMVTVLGLASEGYGGLEGTFSEEEDARLRKAIDTVHAYLFLQKG